MRAVRAVKAVRNQAAEKEALEAHRKSMRSMGKSYSEIEQSIEDYHAITATKNAILAGQVTTERRVKAETEALSAKPRIDLYAEIKRPFVEGSLIDSLKQFNSNQFNRTMERDHDVLNADSVTKLLDTLMSKDFTISNVDQTLALDEMTDSLIGLIKEHGITLLTDEIQPLREKGLPSRLITGLTSRASTAESKAEPDRVTPSPASSASISPTGSTIRGCGIFRAERPEEKAIPVEETVAPTVTNTIR